MIRLLEVSRSRRTRLVAGFIFLIAVFGYFYYITYVAAATRTWDGGGATDNWSDCDNWSDNTCPTSADTALFDGTSTSDSIVDSSFSGTVQYIDINSGYTGTITQARDLTLTGGANSYDQADGTWSQGTTTFTIQSGSFVLSGGTFTTSSSTTNTIENDFTVTGGTFIASSTKVFRFVDNNTSEPTVFTYSGTFPATVSIDKNRVTSGFTLTSGASITKWGSVSLISYDDSTFVVQSGAEAHFQDTSVVATSMTLSGTTTASSTFNLSGSLILNSGAYLEYEAANMYIENDYTDNGATFDESAITFNFDDSSASEPSVFTYSGVFPGTVTVSKNQNTSGFTIASGATIDKWGSISLITYDTSAFVIQSGAFANIANVPIVATDFTVSGKFNASSTFDISGSLTLNASGEINFDGSVMYIENNYTDNGGAFDASGITLFFDDSSASEPSVISCSCVFDGVIDFYKNANTGYITVSAGTTVTLGDDASTVTYAASNVTVNGTLITNGYNLTTGAAQLIVGTGGVLVLHGDETITSPTLNEDSTIEYNGTSTYSSLIAGYDYENLHFTASGTYNIAASVNVEDDFLSSGDANFNQTSGTFTLDGADQTVTGTSTFNNFTKTVASAATTTFGANQTQTISGTLTLQGASGQELGLVSNSPGTQYKIDMQGARLLEYLNVTDINNINSDTAYCGTGCTDGGNNTNFEFTADPDNGYLYWDNGGGDSNWSTCANWKFNTCPTSVFVAAFDSRATGDADIDVSFAGEVKGLFVESGYTGTITSYRDLTIGSDGFSQADGTFIAPTTTLTTTSFTHTDGTYTHSSGGVILDITNSSYALTPTTTTVFYDLESNSPGTLDDNLTAYYKLDETKGSSATDSSGSGNTGTLTNMEDADWSTTDLPPTDFHNVSSITTNASDEYILANLDIGSTWSVATWFKWPLESTGSWNTLLRDNTSGHHQTIVRRSDNLLGGYYSGAFRSSGYDMDSLSDGWHHLTVVGSGSNSEFYIDGVSVGTIAYKSTTEIYAIGNWQGGSQQWGQFDDFRLYSKALSQAEITALASGSNSSEGENTLTLAGDTVDINNNLMIAGTWDVSAGGCNSASCNIEVAGDWSNNGTFTARTGKVTLDGASQNLTGTTTFYDFEKSVTSADTITFGADQTFTSSGSFILRGTSGNLLTVTSSDGSTDWNVDAATYQSTTEYLALNRSSSASTLYCFPGCTDGGTNTNWLFIERPQLRETYRLQGGSRWLGGVRFGQ